MGQDALLYSNILLWAGILFILFCLFLLFRQFGTVYLAKSEAIERDGVPIGRVFTRVEGLSYFTDQLVTNNSFSDKPTIIAFISPGCLPCRELLPDWNKAYTKYSKKVNFILIGVGDKKSFSKLNNVDAIKGELILDPERNILQGSRVRVTPFAFALDENGEVKGKGLCNGLSHIEGLINSLNSDFESIELEGVLN